MPGNEWTEGNTVSEEYEMKCETLSEMSIQGDGKQNDKVLTTGNRNV